MHEPLCKACSSGHHTTMHALPPLAATAATTLASSNRCSQAPNVCKRSYRLVLFPVCSCSFSTVTASVVSATPTGLRRTVAIVRKMNMINPATYRRARQLRCVPVDKLSGRAEESSPSIPLSTTATAIKAPAHKGGVLRTDQVSPDVACLIMQREQRPHAALKVIAASVVVEDMGVILQVGLHPVQPKQVTNTPEAHLGCPIASAPTQRPRLEALGRQAGPLTGNWL